MLLKYYEEVNFRNEGKSVACRKYWRNGLSRSEKWRGQEDRKTERSRGQKNGMEDRRMEWRSVDPEEKRSCPELSGVVRSCGS